MRFAKLVASAMRGLLSYLVTDASVLVPALGDDGAAGLQMRSALSGHGVIVPDLVDCEVLSAWRRAVRTGKMTSQRADRAVHFLSVAPLIRTSTEPLLKLIWHHRENISTYDATYIALAELYEIPLLTADTRLATAPNTTANIHLLP